MLSLERVFHLKENQTTVRRELLAGLTTFMTMAYVVVVNPQVLSEGGMPVDGVLFATCISSAVATLVMGLWANYPIALAPGMSLNAYFTYSIVLGRGVPWQTALGVVFFSGVLFLLLTLSNIREQVVNAIPDCLKHGTAAGIGLFIAFIGLRNAKIIVANPATFVSFGKISDPEVLLAAAGLVFISILVARRFSSAILLGIVAITLAGIPVVAAIPAYATAPALVLVGVLMSGAVARVRWDDFSEASPAFLTLVATPLTFSIATGLSLGVLSFTFVKLGSGRHREVSPLIWVLTVLFILRYAFVGSE